MGLAKYFAKGKDSIKRFFYTPHRKLAGLSALLLCATLSGDASYRPRQQIFLPPVEIQGNSLDARIRDDMAQRYLSSEGSFARYSRGGNKYAILVNGTDSDIADYDIFKRNSDMMETLLNERGYLTIAFNPRDHGENDIHKFIKAIGNLSDKDSKFVFVYSGHADRKEGSHYMAFSDNRSETVEECEKKKVCDDGRIYDKELFHLLKRVKGKKAVIVGSCYSGGFADYMRAHPRGFDGVVMTSAPYDKQSWFFHQLQNSYFFFLILNRYKDLEGELNISELDLDSRILEKDVLRRIKQLKDITTLDTVQIESTSDFEL